MNETMLLALVGVFGITMITLIGYICIKAMINITIQTNRNNDNEE